MNFRNFKNSPPAFSIPIILGLVSLMILLMVVLYSQAYESLKYSSNTKNSTIAYYYAAALQEAQLEASKHASGYELNKPVAVPNGTAEYTIYGLSGALWNNVDAPTGVLTH